MDSNDPYHKAALERFDKAIDADYKNRLEGLDDLEFIAGEQWPEDIRSERETAGRPVITLNRMPQFLRQVTGDIRRANPAIDVMAGDEDATEEMADIFGGIIRSIEYKSDATSIYERAAESAAACGIGNFRVIPVQDDRGLNIEIEGIPNPFAVYWDPLSKDPTRSDAQYCFVTSEMTQEDFKKEYPGADVYDFESDGIPNHMRNWLHGEFITVAEYFEKRGDMVTWAKMSGTEVIEGPVEFPSKYIPVFAVCGEELHIGERVVRTSVIRYAKDAQRMYNYWNSTNAEVIALQPKAPYKVTLKQIQGLEDYWQNANTENLPYLPYNPDEKAPPPERETPPVASQGLLQGLSLAAEDMKATTGIYDASLGEKSNETSGVAIRQRQMESDISTSIYVDNLSKSIAQCGRVLVDMIPRIFDTTRSVRTVAVDGSQATVDLNIPIITPMGPTYANDPSFGKFDVRVKTGPSYSTQRQEAAESMLEFSKAYPQAAPVIMDLVARNMDWPGADDVADRLQKLLPPGMAEEEDMTPEQQQIQMLQQQLQQAQQMIEQITQEPAYRKEVAGAVKAEADAERATSQVQEQQLETVQKQMELALQSGQLNAAIEQIVARALQARLPLGA